MEEYGVDRYYCCKKLGQRKTGRSFGNKRVSCVLSAVFKAQGTDAPVEAATNNL